MNHLRNRVNTKGSRCELQMRSLTKQENHREFILIKENQCVYNEKEILECISTRKCWNLKRNLLDLKYEKYATAS